jgi:hypothetical protein
MQIICQRSIGDRGIFVLSGSELRAMIKNANLNFKNYNYIVVDVPT